jgi:hypothetical protein
MAFTDPLEIQAFHVPPSTWLSAASWHLASAPEAPPKSPANVVDVTKTRLMLEEDPELELDDELPDELEEDPLLEEDPVESLPDLLLPVPEDEPVEF